MNTAGNLLTQTIQQLGTVYRRRWCLWHGWLRRCRFPGNGIGVWCLRRRLGFLLGLRGGSAFGGWFTGHRCVYHHGIGLSIIGRGRGRRRLLGWFLSRSRVEQHVAIALGIEPVSHLVEKAAATCHKLEMIHDETHRKVRICFVLFNGLGAAPEHLAVAGVIAPVLLELEVISNSLQKTFVLRDGSNALCEKAESILFTILHVPNGSFR